MATTNIELDIENITGVADADNQFIISAQKFIVSSVPKNLLTFAQKASSASTDGSAISFSFNDSIIDVQRNGYSCKEIQSSESIWALDSSSLKFATAKHPTWYHKQGAVHFAPVTDGSNAGYVFYVDYSLIDDNCDLRNAVINYACSKEFSKLASSTLPTWSDITPNIPPVAPSAPSFTNPDVASVTISNIGTPPSYTPPTVGGTADELTDVTQLDIQNTIDDFDGNAIEVDQWFATAAHLIEDEEDTELAAVHLEKIKTYVQAYSQQMQNSVNVFNKESTEYQAKLQEAIAQAQINAEEARQESNSLLQKENQEYAATLQKYQSELQSYTADLQKYQSQIASETQKTTLNSQKAQIYLQESDKYYKWAQQEINSYIRNNAKMIGLAMATQSQEAKR